MFQHVIESAQPLPVPHVGIASRSGGPGLTHGSAATPFGVVDYVGRDADFFARLAARLDVVGYTCRWQPLPSVLMARLESTETAHPRPHANTVGTAYAVVLDMDMLEATTAGLVAGLHSLAVQPTLVVTGSTAKPFNAELASAQPMPPYFSKPIACWNRLLTALTHVANTTVTPRSLRRAAVEA